MVRGEVTGCKTQPAPPIHGPPVERAVYTIAEFCLAHQISQAMYFKEKAAGRGPLEMKVGARRYISFEAAAAWRSEREQAGTTANA
jgi:hypothetical protein